jgi:hypothetical protein
MMRGAGTSVMLISLVVAGCSPSPPGSKLRIYAADVTGGAKFCEVPKVDPVADKTTQTSIKVGNDGGWCGLRVRQDGSKPFDAGLLVQRPEHGTVVIHEVGDDTRVDFTPDRGFTGSDSFAVKLIPGSVTLNVAVTITVAAP